MIKGFYNLFYKFFGVFCRLIIAKLKFIIPKLLHIYLIFIIHVENLGWICSSCSNLFCFSESFHYCLKLVFKSLNIVLYLNIRIQLPILKILKRILFFLVLLNLAYEIIYSFLQVFADFGDFWMQKLGIVEETI